MAAAGGRRDRGHGRARAHARQGGGHRHVLLPARLRGARASPGARRRPGDIARHGRRATKKRVATACVRPVASAPWRPGDKAPTFTLLDQDGRDPAVRLPGRKVLVYFYPKADTTGCTAQACGLRDVPATSATPRSRHQPRQAATAKFVDKYGLGFHLAGRRGPRLAEAFGAWGEKSMYGKKYMGIIRSAFLVDATARWPRPGPRSAPRTLRRRCWPPSGRSRRRRPHAVGGPGVDQVVSTMTLPPFQALLDEHAADLHRYLVASAGAHDGADAFQETVIAALPRLPALRSDRNLRGWLFTIAHRKVIDTARGAAGRPRPRRARSRRCPAVEPRRPGDEDLWSAVRALPPSSVRPWSSATCWTGPMPRSPPRSTAARRRPARACGPASWLRRDLPEEMMA